MVLTEVFLVDGWVVSQTDVKTYINFTLGIFTSINLAKKTIHWTQKLLLLRELLQRTFS
jgi:hypothetical protein